MEIRESRFFSLSFSPLHPSAFFSLSSSPLPDQSNELELLISRVNGSRAPLGLKDILYYSAVVSSRPSDSTFFALFPPDERSGADASESPEHCVCGFAARGRLEETSDRRGRGQTVKLARLARDEGLITTLEKYLRAMVCVFHPRSSFVPLLRSMQRRTSSLFSVSFFFLLSRPPRLVSTLFTFTTLDLCSL